MFMFMIGNWLPDSFINIHYRTLFMWYYAPKGDGSFSLEEWKALSKHLTSAQR
jgi:hypothetical protein